MNLQKQFVSFFVIVAISCFAGNSKQYVKISSENLRDTPEGEIIGKVMSGTELNVLERKSNWVKVQMTGWIWESSLTEDSTLVEGFVARASHIVVKSESDAKKILEKLKEGQKFEDMAETFSIDRASGKRGGDLGKFKRGDLMPDFEEAVLSLKVGDYSKIVQTPLGYHIIKRTR